MSKSIISNNGKLFWEIVINIIGGEHFLTDLQKEVLKIIDCSPNIIYSGYERRSMPGFMLGMAIAIALKVSPFELGLFTMIDTNEDEIKNLSRIEKINYLNRLFAVYSEAYNIKIHYSLVEDNDNLAEYIISSKTTISAMLKDKTTISAMLREGYSSLYLTCSGNVPLHGIYPHINDVSINCESHYFVHCGNIYPAESRNIIETESLHEYIERMFETDSYSNLCDEVYKWYRAYRKKRYAFGMLGELSADNFYKLQYLIGYLTKE